MNKLKKITSIALAVLLVFASIPTINVSAAKIKLNKTKITIYVGKTVTLKVQNNKKKVKWTTSNKKIATVTKKGKVKGKKSGKATITATVGKKKYADVEDEMYELKAKCDQLQKDFLRLIERDAEVFEPLSKAYGMPKETEEEQAEKEKVMEAALKNAAEAPLCIMKTIVDTMEMIRVLGEKGSRLAVSDAGVAILFAQAALEGASLNIFINTKMMKDQEEAERLNYRADQLIATGKELKETTYDAVLKGIRP